MAICHPVTRRLRGRGGKETVSKDFQGRRAREADRPPAEDTGVSELKLAWPLGQHFQ